MIAHVRWADGHVRGARHGFIGPVRFPLRLVDWLIGVELTLRYRLAVLWNPLAAHPETLYGLDGDPPYFLRADLAATPLEAAAKLALDAGIDLAEFAEGMQPVDSIEQAWMVLREQTCHVEDCEIAEHNHWIDDDCWYDHVKEPADDAVAYWMWNW